VLVFEDIELNFVEEYSYQFSPASVIEGNGLSHFDLVSSACLSRFYFERDRAFPASAEWRRCGLFCAARGEVAMHQTKTVCVLLYSIAVFVVFFG